MKSALCVPASCFNPLSNVRKTLDDDGGSRRYTDQYAFAQHVIAIASEALFASREAAKVLFSGLRAIRLKFPFKAETPFGDFSPNLFAVHSPVACDSGAANAEIDTKCGSIVDKRDIGQLDDDMKNKLAFSINEIGGSRLVADDVLRVTRNHECYFLPTGNRGQVDSTFRPIDFERVQVKPWRAESGRRSIGLAAFLGKRDSRLNRFGCFLSGLAVQIGNKIGIRRLTVSVSQFVQCECVALLQPPTFSANQIKGRCELTHGFKQYFGLLHGRFQRQFDRPVHM
jgi:hypothetical protein